MGAGNTEWVSRESTANHCDVGSHGINVEVYVAVFCRNSATSNHVQSIEDWCKVEANTQNDCDYVFHVSDSSLDDAGEECKTQSEHAHQ